mgnify:CR=1 FL=1
MWRRSSERKTEPVKLEILHALNAERAARRAAVVVTDIASGEQRFVPAAAIAADPLRDVLDSRLRTGKSGMADTPSGRVFLTVYVPPPKLVITGAVHISQALAPMALLLGYDVNPDRSASLAAFLEAGQSLSLARGAWAEKDYGRAGNYASVASAKLNVAHRNVTRDDIKRFLNRPEATFKPTTPLPTPPGDPIGAAGRQ